MKAIFVFCLLAMLCAGCRKNYSRETECIQASVESFKKTAICDSGASVRAYEFAGLTVYVFHPGNCGADMQAPVLDQNCRVLGYLGGLAGNTRINGVEFSSNSYYLRTVWSN
jgi:hypothetical protein